MNTKEIINKVNNQRQTVKAYSDKKISAEDWEQILDTIYWSPTSHGAEPYRVLIINRKNALRKEMQPAMWNQGTVIEADKLVLFISLKRSVFASLDFVAQRVVRRFKEIANKNVQIDSPEVLQQANFVIDSQFDVQELSDDWSMKQAYIALGMSFYTAALLGIGSTPIEGFVRKDLDKLLASHDLLDIKTETVALAAAFGFPKSETSYGHWGTGKRVRDPKEVKFKEI